MKGLFCGQECPGTLTCRGIWPAEINNLLSNESSDYDAFCVITSTELMHLKYYLFTTINTYNWDKSGKIQMLILDQTIETYWHICQGHGVDKKCFIYSLTFLIFSRSASEWWLRHFQKQPTEKLLCHVTSVMMEKDLNKNGR